MPHYSCPFPRGRSVFIPVSFSTPIAVVFAAFIAYLMMIFRSFRVRRLRCCCCLPSRRVVVTLIGFSTTSPNFSSSSSASLYRVPFSQAPLEEEVVRGADGVVTPAQQRRRRPFHHHRRCRFAPLNTAATLRPPTPPRERYRAGEKLVVDVGAPGRHGRVRRRLRPRGGGVRPDVPVVLPDLRDVGALGRVGVEDSRQEVYGTCRRLSVGGWVRVESNRCMVSSHPYGTVN